MIVLLITAVLIILMVSALYDAGTKGKSKTKLKNADELVKWKTLYDQGVISEEEFNQKKNQLLK